MTVSASDSEFAEIIMESPRLSLGLRREVLVRFARAGAVAASPAGRALTCQCATAGPAGLARAALAPGPAAAEPGPVPVARALGLHSAARGRRPGRRGSKVLLFILRPLGIISWRPCPRVRPRRHATQRARSEIFKLSLAGICGKPWQTSEILGTILVNIVQY